jgi:DNA repair ATPase RecN
MQVARPTLGLVFAALLAAATLGCSESKEEQCKKLDAAIGDLTKTIGEYERTGEALNAKDDELRKRLTRIEDLELEDQNLAGMRDALTFAAHQIRSQYQLAAQHLQGGRADQATPLLIEAKADIPKLQDARGKIQVYCH